jgi:CHAT domain-containing protein
MTTRPFHVAFFVGSLVLMLLSGAAYSASHEQIVEKCRELMHPQIMACAQAKGLMGNHEAIRQQCGMGLVRPCVIREEQKQAAHVAPPAVPKDETGAAPPGAPQIQPSFVAPPRTIADITAILDNEKPDEAQIAARKASADAAPPSNASAAALAQFYYDRGNARALLVRNKEAIADGLQAIAVGKGTINVQLLQRIRQFVAFQYRELGELKQAMATFEQMVHDGNEPGRRGSTVNPLRNMTRIAIDMGDIGQAEAYARRVEALVQEARGSPNPNWRTKYPIYGHTWEAEGNVARGFILQARGQYAEAEAAYRRAEAFFRATLKDLPRFESPPPPEQILQAADNMLRAIATEEAKQGRLSEAEADARRALLGILKARGKYSPVTPMFTISLASILVEQGRYHEAENLARSALDIQRTIGIADDSLQHAGILSQLGNILVLQDKMRDASVVYGQLGNAIAQWNPPQREPYELNDSRILALYASGELEAGLAAAERLVKSDTAKSGENSFDTASARGILAIGYARVGRAGDAVREFKASIPVMVTAARENAEDDDPTIIIARRLRLQRIVEVYIDLLARDAKGSNDIAVETFPLADVIHGHGVEQSLANASARMIAKDPALAELVRNAQDLGKQISAELGILNNILALTSDQRDDQRVRAINAEIERLRASRNTAQAELKRRFPSYADLIDPKPPSVEEIRATLRPGEALLSFYLGQDASFVWALPKDGPVVFASVPLTGIELSAKVHRLREALEPQVLRVEEIPPFDVSLAYEIYAALLKPVEAGWKDAKSLIVVTNGALGELPFGLLPIAPAHVDSQTTPLFAGYRDVPWLAHTHAVTLVPAASALITLRRLPPGSPQRDKLIGFGDPYFNAQQAAEADQIASAPQGDTGMDTRSIPLRLRASPHTEEVDVAELAMLPRLPDTRQELLAMALALDADPGKALYLGRDANEKNVETLDLSRYRIVAFATHGLVPGDIDGLTQPALALTAPEVAGISGDGLLTMEKILSLKLDADWVVLSACNTAAGAGAGAEAASGLGSAFFYAGTRALLVTNWSVHSASARELMGDLFRRQRDNPALAREEALRQAMMALVDGAGFVDGAGRTLFTYAHPLFWAPYSVIGDGGGS